MGLSFVLFSEEYNNTYPIGGGHTTQRARGPEAIWIGGDFFGIGRFYKEDYMDARASYHCPSADLLTQNGRYGWPNYDRRSRWVSSSYVYRSSYEGGRTLSPSDESGLSIVTDWFMYKQENKGVNHIESQGMSVLYNDGSASFVDDDFFNLINHPNTHLDWDGNEYVWNELSY